MNYTRTQFVSIALAAAAGLGLIACKHDTSSMTGDQSELDARMQELMAERDHLEEQIDSLRSENAAKLSTVSKELHAKESELKSLKSELKEAREEKERIEESFEAYRKDYKASIRSKAKGIELGAVTLTSGKNYANVVVSKWEPDGLRVMHTMGSAKLPFEELTGTIQDKFAYDPAETATLLAQSAATKPKPPPASSKPTVPASTSNAPKPWPKSGLPDEPKRKLTKTEIAIGKLSRQIETKEAEVNRLDKQIEDAFRRGSDSRGRSLSKRAERIMDDLKTLRANRADLERKRDSRRRA